MKKIIIIIVLALLFRADVTFSDTVEIPVKIALSRQSLTTLSVPRWKGFMHQTNPNELWFSFANWDTQGTHLVYSTNGGDSWTSSDLFLSSSNSIDYHLSASGDAAGNFYATMPVVNDIQLRKVNYHGQSSADLDPTRTVWTVPGNLPRSSVMIEPGNNRIWVFTRSSGVPVENVRYHYSDNDGVSWTRGIADPTNANEVRIGSMPYVNGRPALVVAYMSNSQPWGYRYFLWNGSAFVAEQDSQIYDGPLGLDRAFTHNVTSGDYFHLMFGLDDTLYHYWKQYNNGTGSWNSEVVDVSAYNTGSIDWETSSTVRGSELYLFYSKSSSADQATSEIYYKKWTEAAQSWTTATVVSTHAENTNNHHPNTVMSVPTSSNFIPLFWYSHLGSSNEQIYFNKISVDSTTVSRLDIDLKVKDFKEGTATEQEVLDLIETYNNDNTTP